MLTVLKAEMLIAALLAVQGTMFGLVPLPTGLRSLMETALLEPHPATLRWGLLLWLGRALPWLSQ